jgi:hypothetical protein
MVQRSRIGLNYQIEAAGEQRAVGDHGGHVFFWLCGVHFGEGVTVI